MAEVPALGQSAAQWTADFKKAFPEVFGALEVAKLQPTVQGWEHLLCECRKVFGVGGDNASERQDGLEELWRAAKALYE
jgi:hypothetical protein